jgi:hypothetical protein
MRKRKPIRERRKRGPFPALVVSAPPAVRARGSRPWRCGPRPNRRWRGHRGDVEIVHRRRGAAKAVALAVAGAQARNIGRMDLPVVGRDRRALLVVEGQALGLARSLPPHTMIDPSGAPSRAAARRLNPGDQALGHIAIAIKRGQAGPPAAGDGRPHRAIGRSLGCVFWACRGRHNRRTSPNRAAANGASRKGTLDNKAYLPSRACPDLSCLRLRSSPLEEPSCRPIR